MREGWKGVGLWARLGLSPYAREVQIRACSAWIFPQVVAPHEESLDSLTLCQLLSQVFVPENVKKKQQKKRQNSYRQYANEEQVFPSVYRSDKKKRFHLLNDFVCVSKYLRSK